MHLTDSGRKYYAEGLNPSIGQAKYIYQHILFDIAKNEYTIMQLAAIDSNYQEIYVLQNVPQTHPIDYKGESGFWCNSIVEYVLGKPKL